MLLGTLQVLMNVVFMEFSDFTLSCFPLVKFCAKNKSMRARVCGLIGS